MNSFRAILLFMQGTVHHKCNMKRRHAGARHCVSALMTGGLISWFQDRSFKRTGSKVLRLRMIKGASLHFKKPCPSSPRKYKELSLKHRMPTMRGPATGHFGAAPLSSLRPTLQKLRVLGNWLLFLILDQWRREHRKPPTVSYLLRGKCDSCIPLLTVQSLCPC